MGLRRISRQVSKHRYFLSICLTLLLVASQENVRCVMGYIVDLTVILDGIFRLGGGRVSVNEAQTAMDRHLSSGRRDSIHRDINSFVTETFAIRFTVPQRDLVLEKIIDLIRQYCVPPSAGGYR